MLQRTFVGQSAESGKGELCGSSYINKAMKAHLNQRLKGETYLDKSATTRESLIEMVLVEFENNLKRTFDITKDMEPYPFWVPQLKGNSRKGFEDETLFLKAFVLLIPVFSVRILNQSQGRSRRCLPPAVREDQGPCRRAEGRSRGGWPCSSGRISHLRLEIILTCTIQKVILVGGFAGSPSLYKYLHTHLFPTFVVCPNPL
jgi:hypothetical protein